MIPEPEAGSDSTSDFTTRFAGVARLFSSDGLARLRRAHVAVVGIGGVGSWAVEALARSGVGALTLIDLDEVCLSNTNRQLPALTECVGRPKVEVMAERVRGINPACCVTPVVDFLTEANATRLLAPEFSCVVDAIDHVAHKCCLIAAARAAGRPLIVCGGAGGRCDPTRLRVADLSDVTNDRLLAAVRQQLRRKHGFPPAGKPCDVECVFSPESPVFPLPDGSVCSRRPTGTTREDRPVNCDSGWGTAAFVTGAFGLAAAAWVVRHLAEAPRK